MPAASGEGLGGEGVRGGERGGGRAGGEGSGGRGQGASGGEIEIALLNPNGYPEAAARRLRPWLAELLAALLAARPRSAARLPGAAPLPAVACWAAAAPPGPGAPAVPGAPAGPEPPELPEAPADTRRSFGVRFAGDRAMRRANRQFRGKDQTTDVLSFPGPGAGGAGAGGGAGGHLGDVLISVPQARRQAAAAGRGAEREIRVLLLHGVLHCLGYDHEADGGEMERLERRLRRRWLGRAARPARHAAGPAGPAKHRRPGRPPGRARRAG